MKSWMNILFYLICFFVLAATIYRLALCIPPLPDSPEYAGYCIKSAAFAAGVSGMLILSAGIFSYREEKKEKDEKKKK